MVHGIPHDFLRQHGFPVSIDAGNRGDALHCVVTHAHSDHAIISKNSASQYFMTPETRALVQSKIGKKNAVRELAMGERVELDDGVSLSFRWAGHMLGSAQVLLENNRRLLASSDFKLEESILFPGAEATHCDSLILESTFGMPQYAFPPREQTYHEIGHWAKREIQRNRFVLLAGYAMGKSQELTKVSNEFIGEIPLVHEKIFENNSVYEQFGVKLGKFVKMDHNLKDFNVLILPPSLVSAHLIQALQFSLQKKVVAGIATGWNFSSPYYDKLFPLSDHADFNQLISFVQQCAPKMVYTHHGFAEELAGFIQRRLRIPARSLDSMGQKAMVEFC